MLRGEAIGTPLNGRSLDLDRRAAAPADQVMVVGTPTSAVELFTRGQPHRVDVARIDEKLKRSIDGREPDLRAPAAEIVMELLGRTEVVQLLQQGKHLAPLTGVARGRCGGTRC